MAHIGSIIIAYNLTRSLVTRYSLYFLMFGRRPQLPINLLFPTRGTQAFTCTIDEYIASLYDRLRKSLVIAQDCAVKEAQRQKRLYDRKVGAVEGITYWYDWMPFEVKGGNSRTGGAVTCIWWLPAWWMGYLPM